jgi:hypothetical protein
MLAYFAVFAAMSLTYFMIAYRKEYARSPNSNNTITT